MAVNGTVLANLDGLVFNKGFMYGTRSGGSTDAIAFGALQSIRLNHTFQKVELRGPESLSPLGVGIGSEQLSGSFESGVVTPEQFVMAMGGSMSYDAGTDKTTYTKTVDQEPRPFNLHFQSQAANPDVEIQLYNCVSADWNVFSGQNRTFSLGGGGFDVYGQAAADGGVLFTMVKPGNLTNSS